jgi:hypothetical protein
VRRLYGFWSFDGTRKEDGKVDYKEDFFEKKPT